MEIDVTKLPDIQPWPKDKKWIDISSEVAYLMGFMTPKNVGKVFKCVMSYATEKTTKFDLDTPEIMLFCKVLLDNKVIVDIGFKALQDYGK